MHLSRNRSATSLTMRDGIKVLMRIKLGLEGDCKCGCFLGGDFDRISGPIVCSSFHLAVGEESC